VFVSDALVEHYKYLADEVRLSAYERAINATVKRGDVVLDLGSGTGILGLFACRAGAAQVYSIEVGSIIGLAREICRVNGFRDRVTYLRGWSTELELPRKVDVVIADQIGNLGLNVGLVQFFKDARERFLKPGGKLIPACVDLFVAPMECPELFEHVEFWSNPKSGFNLEPVHLIAMNSVQLSEFRHGQVLGAPVLLTTVNLSGPEKDGVHADLAFTIERDAVLHGFGSWFSAQLSQDVTITNSPLDANPMRRRHLFLPVPQPVRVSKNDRVEVTIRNRHRESLITWSVRVRGEAAQKQSTWNGMFLSKEDIQRTLPGFVPRLSPRGFARLSVLTLCDGERPLSEIEQEVLRRHPHLFKSSTEAATFVAEVVTCYTR
jgi:SAM-dependent methyltransferase